MHIHFCFLIRAFFEVGYKPLQGYLVSSDAQKPFDLDSFDERFLFLLWYHTRRMCNENQNSIFNVNMIHPICVWGAHKFEYARFRHGIKKKKQKRIQSQLLSIVSCCCCSNSDNPGCRFPETPRHNWVYCGRDPPICYTPPHLSIFFIIVVVLFFLCCSSFPRFLVSKWKTLIRFRMLSQVGFDLLRPSSPFIRVRVGIYFFGFWVCLFFFLLLLLMLLVLFCYFFFRSNSRTRTQYIYLFIDNNARKLGRDLWWTGKTSNTRKKNIKMKEEIEEEEKAASSFLRMRISCCIHRPRGLLHCCGGQSIFAVTYPRGCFFFFPLSAYNIWRTKKTLQNNNNNNKREKEKKTG